MRWGVKMPSHGALVNCGLRCKPVISSHMCSVLPWEPHQLGIRYLPSSATPAMGWQIPGRGEMEVNGGNLSLLHLGCLPVSVSRSQNVEYSCSCKYSKGVNVQRDKGCSNSRTASTPE